MKLMTAHRIPIAEGDQALQCLMYIPLLKSSRAETAAEIMKWHLHLTTPVLAGTVTDLVGFGSATLPRFA